MQTSAPFHGTGSSHTDQPDVPAQQPEPWNKGKLAGQKSPFKLQEI
jgi:hypothetical protein